MTPQERDLLNNLFDRLRQADRGPRDPEAEQLIGAAVAQQPAAPYYLAQVVLVQDQALSAAQARIRDLEQKVAAAAAPAPARSFLGDAPVAGPWGQHSGARMPAASAPASAPPPPVAAPMPAAPAVPAASQPGGGFLRGALQTAAGVAGGALLFEGISSLLHLGGGSAWGAGHSFLPTAGAPTLIEETVINQFGDAPPSALLSSQSDLTPQSDPPLQQASWGDDQGGFTPAVDDNPGDNPADDMTSDNATPDDADLPDQGDTDLV